jgi:hypothetical protein
MEFNLWMQQHVRACEQQAAAPSVEWTCSHESLLEISAVSSCRAQRDLFMFLPFLIFSMAIIKWLMRLWNCVMQFVCILNYFCFLTSAGTRSYTHTHVHTTAADGYLAQKNVLLSTKGRQCLNRCIRNLYPQHNQRESLSHKNSRTPNDRRHYHLSVRHNEEQW